MCLHILSFKLLDYVVINVFTKNYDILSKFTVSYDATLVYTIVGVTLPLILVYVLDKIKKYFGKINFYKINKNAGL